MKDYIRPEFNIVVFDTEATNTLDTASAAAPTANFGLLDDSVSYDSISE